MSTHKKPKYEEAARRMMDFTKANDVELIEELLTEHSFDKKLVNYIDEKVA